MHFKHYQRTLRAIQPDNYHKIHHICDMIKGNESDVWNIDFELQAERGDKFLCFTLFLKLKSCSYLWNQMSN